MRIKWKALNRKVHYWGSIASSLPLLIIIITGLLLFFKKQSDWIQPVTVNGSTSFPTIGFDDVLKISQKIPEAQINKWSDINRLDVRPKKGVIKIRSNNDWEIQIDHQTGEVLNIGFRRSDIIEALHTGTFFTNYVSYGIFLPAAIILLILLITGMYLFINVTQAKNKNKRLKKEVLTK